MLKLVNSPFKNWRVYALVAVGRAGQRPQRGPLHGAGPQAEPRLRTGNPQMDAYQGRFRGGGRAKMEIPPEFSGQCPLKM